LHIPDDRVLKTLCIPSKQVAVLSATRIFHNIASSVSVHELGLIRFVGPYTHEFWRVTIYRAKLSELTSSGFCIVMYNIFRKIFFYKIYIKIFFIFFYINTLKLLKNTKNTFSNNKIFLKPSKKRN